MVMSGQVAVVVQEVLEADRVIVPLRVQAVQVVTVVVVAVLLVLPVLVVVLPVQGVVLPRQVREVVAAVSMVSAATVETLAVVSAQVAEPVPEAGVLAVLHWQQARLVALVAKEATMAAVLLGVVAAAVEVAREV